MHLLAGFCWPTCLLFKVTNSAVQGLGLVFVAVYQRALKLLYVDALLQRVKADFAQQYAPKRYDYASFEELFRCPLLPLWAAVQLHSGSYTAMPHAIHPAFAGVCLWHA